MAVVTEINWSKRGHLDRHVHERLAEFQRAHPEATFTVQDTPNTVQIIRED